MEKVQRKYASDILNERYESERRGRQEGERNGLQKGKLEAARK